MGGIATFDVTKIRDDVNGPMVLTPDAILQFARVGVFFDVSHETISDRSKANLLGKGLVCMQVIWFLIQCVARAAARYPLVLIEVHTMVHVVCALLMYVLWWEVSLEMPLEGLRQLMMLVKKPQDISEPTIQDTSSHLDVLAMLTMTSWTGYFSFESPYVTYYGKEKFKRSQSSSALDQEQTPDLEVGSHEVKVKIMSESPQSQTIRPSDPSKGQVCALVPGQALDCGIGPLESPYSDPDKITYLSAKDVLRWNKASEWLENWERQHPEFQLGRNSLWDSLWKMLKYGPTLPLYSLVGNISDFPGTLAIPSGRKIWFYTLRFVIENRMFLLLLVTLPLLYGGIHLATWDFHFASKTEHLLWKIACIDIMGTIPVGALYGLIDRSSIRLIYMRNDDENRRIFTTLSDYLAWAFYGPLSILYALSRLYIVVESFISLRHVPIGVYAAVPWVQDIPHV